MQDIKCMICGKPFFSDVNEDVCEDCKYDMIRRQLIEDMKDVEDWPCAAVRPDIGIKKCAYRLPSDD